MAECSEHGSNHAFATLPNSTVPYDYPYECSPTVQSLTVQDLTVQGITLRGVISRLLLKWSA